MKIQRTKQFEKDYSALSEPLKKRAKEKLILFFENPRHPSLQVKKMSGYENIWEGRISYQYRFTFSMVEDVCILRRIGSHDILNRPE
ncbi:hypothetical protein GF406_20645 [candidate division KSB1 bacterium]|nr:hypothetical protein [candidate division KSB1 bacterium]